MADSDKPPPPTYILKVGDVKAQDGAGRARRAHGARIPGTSRSRATSAGRRAALANWLASPENPLTARVMVNRIWQFRMGTGIVATPNDFGVLGERPTNPEAARLAGGGVHGAQLEREGDRPADRALECVPADVG